MTSPNTSIVLGAGPLGRAIANQLASDGQTVVVVTRDGRDIGPGIDTRAADLSSVADTIAACESATAIYFCAAPPYHKWQSDFPALQHAAIEAAAATGAVLVAVENLYGYGRAGHLTEELPLTASTRKGAVRADMSKGLLETHASGRAKCVAGRATDFFGPGVNVSALGDRFWPAILSGKPIDWVGDPDVEHSFAFLPDLAKAYIALATTPDMWGSAWHLPALPPITVRELCVKIVGDDPTPKIRTTPSWILRLVGMFQPAAGELIEMRYMFDHGFIIDHSRFDAHGLGVETRSWDDAIHNTKAWWQSQ
ncbi:MAG: NAD-dependent epimerase/dehydratase family protein [Pseudomonadota bacterium]